MGQLGAQPTGRSGPVLEEIEWQVLRSLQDRYEPDLREIASACGGKAAEWQSGEPGEVRERAFRAGQLASLAALARAALAREVPQAVERLRRRANALKVLRSLDDRDQRLSELARAVGLDVSQTDREVDRLVEVDLVRTDKQGHERWIRITDLGRTALERGRGRRRTRSTDRKELLHPSEPVESSPQVVQAVEGLLQAVEAHGLSLGEAGRVSHLLAQSLEQLTGKT